jgi:uncharacterized membrane protein YdbT with pleckstrin-like domain
MTYSLCASQFPYAKTDDDQEHNVSYVNSVLQPGETIKAVGKLHWIIFVRGLLLGAIGIVIVACAPRAPQNVADGLLIVGGLVALVGAATLVHALFERWITELSVTNHRVIYKRGFIRRHTVEMNMDKVETVNVDQSIMGRLLGFGTIHVLGTGQGIESLARIASPIGLRNAITAR